MKRGGSSRDLNLNDVYIQIAAAATRMDVWLDIEYVNTKFNEADLGSRLDPAEDDRVLPKLMASLHEWVQKIGAPPIKFDLMASRYNTQNDASGVPLVYFSKYPEEGIALDNVNIFTRLRNPTGTLSGINYCFPNREITDRAIAFLMNRKWPTILILPDGNMGQQSHWRGLLRRSIEHTYTLARKGTVGCKRPSTSTGLWEPAPALQSDMIAYALSFSRSK